MKKLILIVLIWQSYVMASDESGRLLVPSLTAATPYDACPKGVTMQESSNGCAEQQIDEKALLTFSIEHLEVYRSNLALTKDSLEREYEGTPQFYGKMVGAASAPPLLCGSTSAAVGGVLGGHACCVYAMLSGLLVSTPFSFLLVRNVISSYNDPIDAKREQVVIAIDAVDNAIKIKRTS